MDNLIKVVDVLGKAHYLRADAINEVNEGGTSKGEAFMSEVVTQHNRIQTGEASESILARIRDHSNKGVEADPFNAFRPSGIISRIGAGLSEAVKAVEDAVDSWMSPIEEVEKDKTEGDTKNEADDSQKG